MFRVFKQVQKVAFGAGAIRELESLLEPYRKSGNIAFLVDEVHRDSTLAKYLPVEEADALVWVNVDVEPKVEQVDRIKEEIRSQVISIGAVVGFGGGSTLDLAKGVSVVLTNEGPASSYQGWDLVKNPAVPKIGIPTLSGTGSEASRTAVFTAADKKFGINSDFSMFDLVLLDPELIATVPNEQRFYTGMDCYIHSVESITGSFINAFGRVYARNALDMCRSVFLKEGGTDEDLMVASYLGGASVANSEVGVVHAMSYGLSLILGYRHGIANCIAFDQLEEYYPEHVPEFREMMRLNQIELPRDVTASVTEDQLEAMVQMTQKMERPLTNALGPDWREKLTPERIRELYSRM